MRDYVRLHPEIDAELDTVGGEREAVEEWRRKLYREVNAASEGLLETLVSIDDMRWRYIALMGLND